MLQHLNDQIVKLLNLLKPTVVMIEHQINHIAKFEVERRMLLHTATILSKGQYTSPILVEVQLLTMYTDLLNKYTSKMLQVIDYSKSQCQIDMRNSNFIMLAC